MGSQFAAPCWQLLSLLKGQNGGEMPMLQVVFLWNGALPACLFPSLPNRKQWQQKVIWLVQNQWWLLVVDGSPLSSGKCSPQTCLAFYSYLMGWGHVKWVYYLGSWDWKKFAIYNSKGCMPLRIPVNVSQCTSDHIMSPCEKGGLIYSSKISGFRADSTQTWKLFSKFWLICWNQGNLLFIFEALLSLLNYMNINGDTISNCAGMGRQSRMCGHTGQLIWSDDTMCHQIILPGVSSIIWKDLTLGEHPLWFGDCL